jgi:hypothetical protein
MVALADLVVVVVITLQLVILSLEILQTVFQQMVGDMVVVANQEVVRVAVMVAVVVPVLRVMVEAVLQLVVMVVMAFKYHQPLEIQHL